MSSQKKIYHYRYWMRMYAMHLLIMAIKTKDIQRLIEGIQLSPMEVAIRELIEGSPIEEDPFNRGK